MTEEVQAAMLRLELADSRRRLDAAVRTIAEVSRDLRERHRQELARLRHEIRESIGYEVRELQACLDRPEPLISMARSRARNIERIVERLAAGS